MKNNNTDEAIGRFLLFLLPDQTQLSYRVLAGLEFPLNDYASLVEQIDLRRNGGQWEDAQREAAESVLANLTPNDFPIITPQNALEKFYIRLPAVDLSRFARYWYWPSTPDDEILEDYKHLFISRDCARRAYRTYLEARDMGMNEIDAFRYGYRVNSNCRPRHINPPAPRRWDPGF